MWFLVGVAYMRTWTPPQNASVFFGGFDAKRSGSVVHSASRLRRFILAAGPYGDAGIGSESTRRAQRLVPGCPDPVSRTVCPYPSSGLPTFLPALSVRPLLRREAPRRPYSASRPGDARYFVGQRHRDEHTRLSRKHPGEPRTRRRTSPDSPAHHRHRTRDQQPPHVALAHLRCPLRPWNQPEPGGEVSAGSFLDRRGNRPDPRDAHQPPRLFVRVSARLEPSVQLQYLRFEAGDLLKQNPAQFPNRLGQARSRVSNRRRQSREVRRPLRRDEPGQVTPH